MLTIILLLIVAGLCFAYLRSTQQTKSAKDDAKCWRLLAMMYDNWAEDEMTRADRAIQERDDAWLSIEVMALGYEQQRVHFERSITMLLNQKENA